MAKRAAICIGVSRPAGMSPLNAAARDAQDVEAWAKSQGCDTWLFTDGQPADIVEVNKIFDVIGTIVGNGTYSQLIIYFSGHGILLAPGAEYWLLSRGPNNPNEAINLLRSVEDARNTAIPHIVFISDACRSAANTPLLRAVTGGVVFPPLRSPAKRSEIDVYYATLPGDPANEVPEQAAVGLYRGLFTDCLLKVLSRPPADIVESTVDGSTTLSVLTSRSLKNHLETAVPAGAAAISIVLNQSPEVRVETALPKYFAQVDATRSGTTRGSATPALTVGNALSALGDVVLASPGGSVATPAYKLAAQLGLTVEVERFAQTRGRAGFETRTGFTVIGAGVEWVSARRWHAHEPFAERTLSSTGAPDPIHVRLEPWDDGVPPPSSVVVGFEGGTGTILPVLPGFIGTVVVHGGHVVSVNFVPSEQTDRYADYRWGADQLEQLKAFAAVASRHGSFKVDDKDAVAFADRIRQPKGLDPTMGLYAAYAYAQVGKFDQVYSVFQHMKHDANELPILFDVAMLALRYRPAALQEGSLRIAPFAPLLGQGWTLLMPGDSMHHPVHQRLRPYLLPALFTTLDAQGVAIASMALLAGEEQ